MAVQRRDERVGLRFRRVKTADKAREAGVVYSLAYGDQPALIAEMVDWARSAGFLVAASGKGTTLRPSAFAL